MSALVAALGAQAELLRVGGVFTAAALLLLLVLPRERKHLVKLGLFFALSLALRAASAALGAVAPNAAATLHFLALLLQGIAFLGLVAVVLFALVLPSLRLTVPKIARDLAVALALLILVFYLLSLHHVDVTGIVATSAVVTAVIGFSLQDTLANVMGGIGLQLDGSVSVGDWVKFGEVSGIVREISWRHTSIETRNGDTLIVPNSSLMKSPIMRQGQRVEGGPLQERRWVFFGVDYRYTPTQVIDTVTEALTREPIANVSRSPLPSVILWEFKESWAVYAARYWLTDILVDDPTDSVIRTRVFFALRRSGIPLSLPASTLFLEPRDEARRERHLARLKAERRALVEGVPLFHALTSEERDRLADGLVLAPFAPGEAIVVQGKEVHHLYILTEGSAEVRVEVPGAPPRVVKRLDAPDFFGEMGMLTGEPRQATVVALTPVVCWRLTKETFRSFLEARPQIADEVSRVLAQREVELVSAREGLSEDAKRAALADAHSSLLSRIERFFGL
jgi:small-conductance mechanosensitive channel